SGSSGGLLTVRLWSLKAKSASSTVAAKTGVGDENQIVPWNAGVPVRTSALKIADANAGRKIGVRTVRATVPGVSVSKAAGDTIVATPVGFTTWILVSRWSSPRTV